MQEKRIVTNLKIKKVCIVGVIPSFAFQRAKYCALELHRKLPMRFPPPEIVGLLELDWNEKLTEWKQTFGRDFWCLRRPVAVFFDNKFIGSDIDLIKLATRSNILFENIPRENMNFLKENFRNDYISYIKKTKRIYCYLDICVDGVYVGTLNFELFSELVPRTCENFKNLCLGSKGPLFSYKGSRIHRIVKEGWVQGGDIQYKKGGERYSIFCDPLEDECLEIGHNRRGVLSMANCGRNSNGSQFFITLKPSPWMNSRFVAFGQLIEGLHVLKLIENLETSYECPLRTIEIKNCGKLDLGDEGSIGEPYAERILSKEKPKKIEKISEQILRLIMEALTTALEKKEHHIDILDDGDVPSKMNLQLYFQGLYSMPEEILIKSAEYLRNLRRHLLRVAKPSATEIVEVLTYDLLVATLTRMINLDDMKETLGPDLYNKMISKIDMQLELCQKPYIKKFVDQVVSTAESMIDLVTKKLLHMKKMSKNVKMFQEKMENWLQSFVLQEGYKGDCYHISDRPSWNKSFKKKNVLEEEKVKELSKREGEQCCEKKKKEEERKIMEQLKKKYRPEDLCCLGKKVFDENSDISVHDFFSTCRYDLKKITKNEFHKMPLLDMIEFSRCKLKCMRKQENRVRSSNRICLEEKIRNWMNEVVYTPETMWIRNLIFGKEDIVYDHMEEILYGAMTVGLLEMYYFYEQYLKLCGGKKQKIITRTIYPDEKERKRSTKLQIQSSETSQIEQLLRKPECTCGHPCCVCAFDPHYASILEGEEEAEVPLQDIDIDIPHAVQPEIFKPKILRKTKKTKEKVCPPDMEMIDLNALMAESTSLKADEIDIKSFRWLRSFILEKGCDLKSEFVTQIHNWLDGERFNFKNFLSKHSLVTKASLLSLSLSLAEFIMEENKMKTEITNFIYDLWELYFNEMFKEALIQYPPEKSKMMEDETAAFGSKLGLDEQIRKETIKEEMKEEEEYGKMKERDLEKDLEEACKKILAEAPEFDFTTYCKTRKTELEDIENNDLAKNFEDFQYFEPELKAPPNSVVGIEKVLSKSLLLEDNKSVASPSEKKIKLMKEKNEKSVISEKVLEINDTVGSKPKKLLEQETKQTGESQLEEKVIIVTEEEKEENKKKKKKSEEEKKSSYPSVRNEMSEEERRKTKNDTSEEQITKYNDIDSSETLEKEKKKHQKEIYSDLNILGSMLDQEKENIMEEVSRSEEIEEDGTLGKKPRKRKKKQSPIVIEEIVSDHSSLEESRKMPPYVLPFWIKFLTQLTKQALGTIARISRLPRRLYFTRDVDNDFEDKVKDWIEFNAFNPQPTKGREILDFIALHHKSLTNLEDSARSYLKKKKISLMLNRCTRMKSAEVVANDIITAILETAMTKEKDAETVELYVSRIMSSAITSIQQESEVNVADKYSSKNFFEAKAKQSSHEVENIAGE